MTVAHLDDWGAPAASERELGADDRVVARWTAALERANKGRGAALRLISPLGTIDDLLRIRQLPPMPWPAAWPDLARRCETYPGDMIAVIGPQGSGKSQFAIQMARAFAAAGKGCVLWAPLEMTPVDVSLRIVANLHGVQVTEIRRSWSREQLTNALATVSDRWMFVDVPLRAPIEVKLAALEESVALAKQIYGAPPLLVGDYVQKLAVGAQDKRSALSDAIEALREMTARCECFTIDLSQTSRANTPALTGRVETASASDSIGAGAETSELESACANVIVLNVFKADDSPTLDAHQQVAKARWSGLEGKVGARYTKAGGVWTELDHLPATPLEVDTEVKRSKKGSAPMDPPAARVALNATRSAGAADKRREAIVAALRSAGSAGLVARALRGVKGAGSPRLQRATLDELARGGRARSHDGRWFLIL